MNRTESKPYHLRQTNPDRIMTHWSTCYTLHSACMERKVETMTEQLAERDQQIAALNAACEAAEQERDEWECRYGQAERVVVQDSAALAERDQQIAALREAGAELNAACRWLFTPYQKGNPNLTQVLAHIRSLIESGDRQQPGDGQ